MGTELILTGKVYGAFETLMDLRQQRRLLWILGKLTPDMEEQVTFDEDEEDDQP